MQATYFFFFELKQSYTVGKNFYVLLSPFARDTLLSKSCAHKAPEFTDGLLFFGVHLRRLLRVFWCGTAISVLLWASFRWAYL